MRARFLLVALLAAMLLLGGCQSGDATARQMFDRDDLIARPGDTYSLTGYTAQADGQTVTLSAEKLEGSLTIWRHTPADAAPETITVTYAIRPDHGAVKLVLVTPDGQASEIVSMTAEAGIDGPLASTFAIPAGESRVKLVAAQGTKGTFAVTFSAGQVEAP